MKYNETITKQILEYLKNGLTAKDACFAVGISEETFYTWKKEKPEFSELIERELATFKLTCIRAINDAKDWKAHAWWLERRYPKEFSPKHIDINIYEEPKDEGLTPEQEEQIERYLHPNYKCEKCGHRGDV
ncbi:MAG: transposase [Candidatus Berkelbacteria bacterium]